MACGGAREGRGVDGADFDRVLRTMATSASRRQAVKVLGGGVAGGLLGMVGFRRTEAAYSRRCTRFVLSGGQSPRANIEVDDYIVVRLNGNRLVVKKDGGQPDDMVAGPRDPVRFYARRGNVLRVQAFDTGYRRYLGKLYLHCIEGGEGFQQIFASKLPIDRNGDAQGAGEFFDEEYTI